MNNGDIHMLAIFNRALTDDEIKALSENPYQLFRPTNWRDKLACWLKDRVYFLLWAVLPARLCAWVYGEEI